MANAVTTARIQAIVEGLDQVEGLKGALKQLSQTTSPASENIDKLKRAAIALGDASSASTRDLRAAASVLRELKDVTQIASQEYNDLGRSLQNVENRLKAATAASKSFAQVQTQGTRNPFAISGAGRTRGGTQYEQPIGPRELNYAAVNAALGQYQVALDQIELVRRQSRATQFENEARANELEQRQLDAALKRRLQSQQAAFDAEVQAFDRALQKRDLVQQKEAQVKNLFGLGGRDLSPLYQGITNLASMREQAAVQQMGRNPSQVLSDIADAFSRQLEIAGNGFLASEKKVREAAIDFAGGSEAIRRTFERTALGKTRTEQLPIAGETRRDYINRVGTQADQLPNFGSFSRSSINELQQLRTNIQAFRADLNPLSVDFKQLESQAVKSLQNIDREMSRRNRGLGGMNRLQSFGQTAGAVAASGVFGGPEGFLGSAIGGVFGGAAGALGGGAVGAQVGMLRQQLGGFATYAADVQKLEIALRGVTKTQGEYEAAVRAAAAVTRDFNVPQLEATQGMTQLSAAVIGAGGKVADAEVVFRNVTAAIKATGGSSQDVQGAITALSQIFSKGKVSAEELQGQLGERLPGAVTMFAKATGRTLPQLQKDLEQGVVGLADLMKFVVGQDGLGQYEEGAKRVASSSADAGARLVTTWNQTKQAIGQAIAPLGAEIQDSLGRLLKELTPALIQLARGLAAAIKLVVDNFGAIGNIVKFTAAIAASQAAITLFAGGGLGSGIKAIKDFTAGLLPAIKAQLALNLAVAANPYVLAAAGLAALTVAAYNLNTPFREFVNTIPARFNAFFESLGRDAVAATSNLANQMTAAVNSVSSSLQSLVPVFGGVSEAMANAFGGAFNFIRSNAARLISEMVADLNPWMRVLSLIPGANIDIRKSIENAINAANNAGAAQSAAARSSNSSAQTGHYGRYAAPQDQVSFYTTPSFSAPVAGSSGGGGGGRSGGRTAAKGVQELLNLTAEEIAAAVNTAIGEYGGPDPRGRTDVFANILARSRSGQYPRNLVDIVTQSGEYAPNFGRSRQQVINPNLYGKQLFEQVKAELLNPNLLQQSIKDVDSRLFFKGVSQYGNMLKGVDYLRAPGQNFFHGPGRTDPGRNPQITAQLLQQLSGAEAVAGYVDDQLNRQRKGIEDLDKLYENLQKNIADTSRETTSLGLTGAVAIENEYTNSLKAAQDQSDELLKQLQEITPNLAGLSTADENIKKVTASIELFQQSLEAKAAKKFNTDILALLPATSEYNSKIQENINLLNLRKQGLTEFTEVQKLENALQLLNLSTLATGNPVISERIGLLRQQAGELDKSTKALKDLNDSFGNQFNEVFRQTYLDATNLGKNLGSAFVNAIDGMANALTEFTMTGKLKFGDFAKSLLQDINKILIRWTLFQVFKGFLSPKPAANGAVFAANGMAFANGIKPFANGGIVNNPTIFRYANGGSFRTGVMGEAGPEAIVPLKRGKDGKLGISGGGGSTVVNVSVDASGSPQVQGSGGEAQQLGRVIAAAVQAELVKQKRPGGLLSK